MSRRDKAKWREYMREYMRRRRRLGLDVRDPGARQAPLQKTRAPAVFADLTAALMGDPPIGRRALDEKRERAL
jgi:hypothetical protein